MQNSDAIDGVKFVGTLDGKTCPYCASYDGYIWRGEEIAEARRPPIHPNCRCCLVPYIELKDDEGNVVDVDGDRSAANADFDKLAQDAYNERAREKGWKRRWNDLSPSPRLTSAEPSLKRGFGLLASVPFLSVNVAMGDA